MPQTDNSPAAPRRVRMEEVAKVAGVSLATVSRALKSPDTVSEKLRTRVQEEKVLEWLMENADLKPVAPEVVEPEEVEAAAPEAEAAGEE